MNQDRIQGRWRQIMGKVKEQWGRLTEDDLDVIAGRREQLLGRIQQRYGLAQDGGHPSRAEDSSHHDDHAAQARQEKGR